MEFRIDLHIHTLHSGDNDAEPEAVVRSAIEQGLNGIAFTEHYSYSASSYAKELSEKYAGKLRIFRGVEISALEGHLLVFGVDTDALSLGGTPSAEVVNTISSRGGVVIAPHPYRRGSGIGELINSLNGLTAIEGQNGCNLHAMNQRAIEDAAILGLPVTGGSDAHSPQEVGSCYTVFVEEVPEDGLVEALKAGRYQAVDTRKISRWSFPI